MKPLVIASAIALWVLFTLVFIANHVAAGEPSFCEATADHARTIPVPYRPAALAAANQTWRSMPYDSKEQLQWMWVSLIMERVFTEDENKIRAVIIACNNELGA